MDTNLLVGFITLFIWFGAFVAFLFFLLTQQRILATVRPQERRLRPGRVWLQLIPFFGLIYQFFVTIGIAGSIRKERISRLTENMMTDNGDPAEPSTRRPTIGAGLLFCITNLCYATVSVIYTVLYVRRPAGTMPAIVKITAKIVFLFALADIATWIIYWVTLARVRRRLIKTTSPIS
jgi:hypothetical protein